MTSISKNEMNIQFIPLCNVWHLNGMLNIHFSGNLPEKDALKKIQNTWETINYCYS